MLLRVAPAENGLEPVSDLVICLAEHRTGLGRLPALIRLLAGDAVARTRAEELVEAQQEIERLVLAQLLEQVIGAQCPVQPFIGMGEAEFLGEFRVLDAPMYFQLVVGCRVRISGRDFLFVSKPVMEVSVR